MVASFLTRVGGLVPAASSVALAWNSADKSSLILLSVADTRATRDAPNDFNAAAVRGNIGKSTGKWVFEIDTGSGQQWCGIANASCSLTAYPSATGLNMAFSTNGSALFRTNNEGTTLGTHAAFSPSERATYAVDFDAELIWISIEGGDWNNSGSADPATGTGGFDFSALSAGPYYPYAMLNTEGHDVDIRNSSMAKAIPSGFSAWS